MYMYSIIEDTGNVQSFSDVVLASGDPARTADTWKPRSTKMGGKHAVDGQAIILHHFQVRKIVFGTYQILSVPESLNLTININEPL